MRDIFQILFYFVVLIGAAPFLGAYMAKVFKGERNLLSPVMAPFERLLYRLSGVRADEEMDWKRYLKSLLVFNALGFLVVFLLQIFQSSLPLNPQGLAGVSPALAFNTAVSFMTNTNWQSYSGESTLGYLVQMLGLTVQNFLSAATGIAAFLALVRGLTRRETTALGSFWVDITRSTLYVLLPLSVVIAIALAGQGVVQTFAPYETVTTIEGAQQVVPLGPAASQIAIKQMGTNGGGFFGVNSAHPFENPTPLSNFLEMLSILLIPAALVFTYGKLVGSRRQALAIFATMLILLVMGLAVMAYSEYRGNPLYGSTALMEGKEQRFGIANSILWAEVTTSVSNGSVNAMHDSMSPLTGMVAMLNITLGEIIFGGVGAGMYGMLMFVVLTVFLAGLMVGRTPEYLGKKIQKLEVQWAVLAIIAPSAVILVFAALASVTQEGLAHLSNAGPHGLSEMLYAFASAAGNNGSAFAGLDANNVFYNLLLGLTMLIGRFAVIIPVVAIGGSMAVKKIIPESEGTFRTDSPLFVLLLLGVIVIVVALTFFPALILGPIVEHLLLMKGMLF
ncbi:MAG: potassium-transporting ATPase subunit KdpA [Spirochaetes bacterium]|nr:MAG: potassium-transporting ATPase subunit KdpA [Spirochaetota bacterium]